MTSDTIDIILWEQLWIDLEFANEWLQYLNGIDFDDHITLHS